MLQVAPSILTVDFSRVQETLARLEEASVDAVHFDVMDNHFVPNLTFGAKFIHDLRAYSTLPFDVHLMIASPEKSLEKFLDAGADVCTVHIEASENIQAMAEAIHRAGKSFGIALKPKTPLSTLLPHLKYVHRVLIMTVEPGFPGQQFLQQSLTKIRECRTMIQNSGLDIDIQVDGGINENTARHVIDSGANILVLGTAFFSHENSTQLTASLRSYSTSSQRPH